MNKIKSIKWRGDNVDEIQSIVRDATFPKFGDSIGCFIVVKQYEAIVDVGDWVCVGEDGVPFILTDSTHRIMFD